MALEVIGSNPIIHPSKPTQSRNVLRFLYITDILGCSQGVRQRTLTPSFRWFESSYPNQKATGFMKNPLSVMGGGFFQRKDKSMGDHKLAWILGIVTVVYLIAMILLFWRYRRAMDQLSDKMRECQEKEAAEKLAEAQNQQTEGITAIYRKPNAPEPEEVPETETEETPETKKAQSES